MPRYLLDSNIGIYLLANDESVTNFLRIITGEGASFFFSAISECEIRNNLRPGEHLRADRLLSERRILVVDSKVARRAAQLQMSQRANGRSIKTPDALILATALENELSFVSRDKQLRFAQSEYGLEFIEP
ncbi:type II toxin-antitoxin system VapC family toxin [Alicyclobacillus acidiphilus]|uniref:type II toxin-antitoxin system VapC family toxin n=1 Tax=Alicyclobacillus acidiphilus TaxID=182455 RepID=UPI00083280D6|nr:PIN domain-containing protein [Alicyclobacillus acidiphilus]